MQKKAIPPTKDSISLPEETILLHSNESFSSKFEAVIFALKKVIQERNLNIAIPSQKQDRNHQVLFINDFSIQLVISSFLSSDVMIRKKIWEENKNSPQLVLAAQIDDDQDLVYFKGVLTGKEFVSLAQKASFSEENIELELDVFKGGIERLLTLVQLVEQEALPHLSLKPRKSQSGLVIENAFDVSRKIAMGFVSLGAVYLGSNIFLKPQLQIASLNYASVPINSSLRSTESEQSTVCLFLDTVQDREQNPFPIAKVSFDRPLIYSLQPLSDIRIFKNKKEIWRNELTISAPLSWPAVPIKPGEIYQLSFKPIGSKQRGWATIQLEVDRNNSFNNLNKIIESIGEKESQWRKMINQQIKEDKNLALALLFSDKAPKTKEFKIARERIQAKGCR